MFCKSTWRINSLNIQKLTFLLMTQATLNYIIWRGSHISHSWFLWVLYTSPFGRWRWGNPGVPREKPSQQGENQQQTELITMAPAGIKLGHIDCRQALSLLGNFSSLYSHLCDSHD